MIYIDNLKKEQYYSFTGQSHTKYIEGKNDMLELNAIVFFSFSFS